LELIGTARISRRESSILIGQGFSFALLFSLFYGGLLAGLVRDWEGNISFSYGFLIPFVTLYLVWVNKSELKSLIIRPNVRSAWPLAFALLIGLVALAFGETFTARVSMILALGCSIYLLLGSKFFRALLFPIFYLALMIPIPYVFFKEIAYHLRYFDALVAESALQLIGVPIYREAYFLHLPNITLEVADMCAGIGSIFALFALGSFYVYFLPASPRVKSLLVLSTIPIAVLANLVRIIVVAVMAYYIGPATLDMLFHRFSGTTTFLLALTILALLGEYCCKNWPRTAKRSAMILQSSVIDDEPAPMTISWKPFMIGSLMLICAVLATALLNRGRAVNLQGAGLGALPSELGPFREAQVDWRDRYDDRKVPKSISRVYITVDRLPVEVFIGYKTRQDGTDRLISPKLILPENWNFAWIKPAILNLENAATIDANWMLTRHGEATRLVMYWYQFSSKTVAGEIDYRFELVQRLVLQHRSDGAVVRLATPVVADEPIETAQQRLRALAEALYPELVKVLPL
jgi:EpsI family protein